MVVDVRGLGPKIEHLKATAKEATERLSDVERPTLSETMTYLTKELSGLEGTVSAVDKGKKDMKRLWQSLTIAGMAGKPELERARNKAAEAWLVADRSGQLTDVEAGR